MPALPHAHDKAPQPTRSASAVHDARPYCVLVGRTHPVGATEQTPTSRFVYQAAAPSGPAL